MMCLSTVCCCKQRLFGIAIYNSNAAVDDDFRIYVNDVDVGTIFNGNNLFTGRVFAVNPDAFPNSKEAIMLGFFGLSQMRAFEDTLPIDAAILNSKNRIKIESIVNRNNGNFGAVQVGFWTYEGRKFENVEALELTEIVLNTVYLFSSGVGNGNSLDFNLTDSQLAEIGR